MSVALCIGGVDYRVIERLLVMMKMMVTMMMIILMMHD